MYMLYYVAWQILYIYILLFGGYDRFMIGRTGDDDDATRKKRMKIYYGATWPLGDGNPTKIEG